MSELIETIEKFKLSGTENGKVEVAVIKEPYGKESSSVVSIGIFLKSDVEEPNWKVHLPKNNIDAIISALEKAKEVL